MNSSFKPSLPKPGLLRWEISAALLLKVLLLTGLWFLLFRWQQPAIEPDISSHFALPTAETGTPPTSLSQPSLKESRHVR